VLTRCFLGVEELTVELDLEDAASRRDQRQTFDVVFELLEDAFRQTDGSRRIPSLGAIFDRDLHPFRLNVLLA
jgi:hypothetical protein